jgi:hypothetical protein
MDRSIVRQTTLLVAVFLATLVLLLGAWAMVRQGSATAATPRPSSTGPGSTIAPPTASGLVPSASGGSGGSAEASSPVPSSSELPTAVLTGAGDIASCHLPGAARTSDLLLDQAGTIFTAGDNAYESGSVAEFRDCYQPTWGRVKDRTLPAVGNHDWQTAGAAGYLAYFGSAAEPDGTTWYSTDLGLWHVIVLDANCAKVGGCDADSRQGGWLAADLRAHADVRCTLAIWHQPRFSSGEHGDDRSVGPFWDQLFAAHADLVINGHDHDYERFAPQDAAGREDRQAGMREFVVGTGGAGLRSFPRQAANSEFRLAGVWGVIRLTLHPASFDWEFLPTSGRITDSGHAACH